MTKVIKDIQENKYFCVKQQAEAFLYLNAHTKLFEDIEITAKADKYYFNTKEEAEHANQTWF